MPDVDTLGSVLERQIRSAVDQSMGSYIETVVNQLALDPAWLSSVEQQVQRAFATHVAKQISGLDLDRAINQNLDAAITRWGEQLLNGDDTVGISIRQQIDDAIDRGLTSYAQNVVNELALDPNWISRVETQVQQAFAQRLTQHIAAVDVDQIIADNLDQAMQRWNDRLLKNFRTRGISDAANSIELTIMDGSVVIENELVSQDLDVRGTSKIQDLVVTGSINTDNRSWQDLAHAISEKTRAELTESWSDDLVSRVLNLAQTQGIKFDQVLIGSDPLVANGRLGSAIEYSNLRTVGTLDTLSVIGQADLTDTLHVRNRRLGINTDTPDMALSIWDEEVSIVAGKLSNDRAYIGTGRNQSLVLGVNRQAKVEIDVDGMVTVPALRVGRHQIGYAPEVPGYSGTRGDVLFNSDPRPGDPFAWVCLGAFRWHPLRSA